MQQSTSTKGFISTNDECMQQLESLNKEYLIKFENQDCLIEFWTPRSEDSQPPHDRDEVYIIINGSGEFEMNSERKSIKKGDLIFVAAGVEHRFTKYSNDLAMWIVFFGHHHEGFAKWKGMEY